MPDMILPTLTGFLISRSPLAVTDWVNDRVVRRSVLMIGAGF